MIGHTDHAQGAGVSPIIQGCYDTMAAFYLRQEPDDCAWPPVKATNFINLALIKDQKSWHRTPQKSVDEVVGRKQTTSYHSMLDHIEDCRFTLLEGRPGSGKTTLMNKISCDWANKKVLKSKLVVFIPLRKLNAEPDRSLATILRIACPALQYDRKMEQLVSHVEDREGEGVVFAFDGLDEYLPSYKAQIGVEKTSFFSRMKKDITGHHGVDDVFELFHATLLPKALIVLTSRPAACKEVRKKAKKRIEVLGFLREQISEYIHYYFDNDKEKAQQLEAHLETHPNLMNMAYLPLHCAMLVFLYEDDSILPHTESEFYRHFALSTLLRSQIKRKSGNKVELLSFEQLPPDERATFDNVCKLAFEATISSKQVFKSSEVEGTLTKTDRKTNLGLVVRDRYFMRYGLDETYTFLHLTFQEYLAAIHIAGLNKIQLLEIIKTYGGHANFREVWKFLCGMMDYSNPNTMDAFRDLMRRTSKDDVLFQIRCAYESQNALPCTHIINSVDNRLIINNTRLSPSDCIAIGYVLNKYSSM